jgi:carboxypeptidase Q
MTGRLLTVFLSIVFVSASAQTNEDSIIFKKIADEILVNGKAYENLRMLTKQIGHRLAGSSQMYKAEAWAQQALKEAGADTVWLQECMVPHWVRGPKEQAYIVTKGGKKQTLDVVALGNSLGTGSKGITAPVILINSFDELEEKKDSIKGKIVFYNYKFNDTFIKTFRSYADAVRYRGAGASRAAKHGAVAVLVRSMSHATDNHPHTGAMNYNDSFPKIPAAAIGLRDADKLAEALSGNQIRVFLRTNARMLTDTLGHNVIGEIRGSEFPDQYITVGAHLDSWDIGEGAHDDGAGCVHSIEVLRALKAIGYKPKRSIRIVMFANEENGLRGGTKYAEQAKAKSEQHVFALESDAGGFTPRGFGFTASDTQFEKLKQWIPLFVPYGVYEFNRGGGGADIGPLNRTIGTPIAGLQPDSQRYFDLHHARNDVFEAVNKRELELGAINMAGLIYLIDKYGL